MEGGRIWFGKVTSVLLPYEIERGGREWESSFLRVWSKLLTASSFAALCGLPSKSSCQRLQAETSHILHKSLISSFFLAVFSSLHQRITLSSQTLRKV